MGRGFHYVYEMEDGLLQALERGEDPSLGHWLLGRGGDSGERPCAKLSPGSVSGRNTRLSSMSAVP